MYIFIALQNPVFENCSCIAEGLGGPNTSFVFAERLRINGTADSRLCEKDCTLTLVVFVIGIFAMIFTIFLLKVPTIIITIRYVLRTQRGQRRHCHGNFGLVNILVREIVLRPNPTIP